MRRARSGSVPAFLAPSLSSTSASTLQSSARLRSAYIAISKQNLSTTRCRRSSDTKFHRSDFSNQPFTGSYEPGLPTAGPLGAAHVYGVTNLTPKMLKAHLDQFVVGQDRAKKILAVAVFNHYQRVGEMQRLQDHENDEAAKRERRERHPVETEFPGQQTTIRHGGLPTNIRTRIGQTPLIDTTPLQLEKSNILLLGPSGVGKTLMAKTLARVLEVPFSMSDCTPFTQAGYIGEDAEVCVHRLLAAANYDVARAERGIICLDEVDKIATARVSHGKDVSGEGVQQALLKIIEGTTIQVQAKQEKNGPKPSQTGTYPLGGGSSNTSTTPAAKGEVYNVRTDNILFICSGAFVGLQKHVMDRLAKGSLGFGASVRSTMSFFQSARSDQKSTAARPIPLLPGSEEEALYKKHLPFFTPSPISESNDQDGYPGEPQNFFNPLDLVTPQDLQSFGFIPEFVGRIPTTAALAPLTHSDLLRILTEPRSSLISQYEALFSISGIELRFTTPALHVIAQKALEMGTGARALRTEMETVLGDAMFEAPGSSVKYVLITEKVANREEGAMYFGRGMGAKYHNIIAGEEGEWEEKQQKLRNKGGGGDGDGGDGGGGPGETGSFEMWRSSAGAAAGSGG